MAIAFRAQQTNQGRTFHVLDSQIATRFARALFVALGVMKQSNLLEFDSSAFTIEPGEDEETNPGIFGKALARWLVEQLKARRVSVGEPIAEDFGWVVPVQSEPHRLYVACSSEDDETKKWRTFVFAEGGLLNRLLGKDKSTESVATLYATVKQIIESSPSISNVSEVKP